MYQKCTLLRGRYKHLFDFSLSMYFGKNSSVQIVCNNRQAQRLARKMPKCILKLPKMCTIWPHSATLALLGSSYVYFSVKMTVSWMKYDRCLRTKKIEFCCKIIFSIMLRIKRVGISSVTRFCKILPVWQLSKNLRLLFEGFFSVWTNYEHTFANVYSIGHILIVASGQVLKNQSNNMVTVFEFILLRHLVTEKNNRTCLLYGFIKFT